MNAVAIRGYFDGTVCRVVVGLVEKKFFTSLLLPKLFVVTSAKVMATS